MWLWMRGHGFEIGLVVVYFSILVSVVEEFFLVEEELVDGCWPWLVVTWRSKILMAANFFFLLSIFNLFGRIELCAKMSIA